MVKVTKAVTIVIDGEDVQTLTDIFELARVRLSDVDYNMSQLGFAESQGDAIKKMLARIFDSA